MDISELDTPCVVVDLDRMERNILGFQRYCDEHHIANRPHIKTHKVPEIAWMQMNAGAAGITCQKLGEAEVMAQAGIQDIFLPYNILGTAKLDRLMRLARRVEISVSADSTVVARGLSQATKAAGVELCVLVECDTGMGRCGVQAPVAAAALALELAELPNLRFDGLMTYPNSESLDPFVRETKAILAEDEITVECVSGGGTSVMWQAHTHSQLTEHRAGMYVYGDRYTVKSGALSLEDCAFHVLTTVVSHPTADRGILDAGSKTFSSDLLGMEGHGLILEYPEAQLYTLSEEHGIVDFSQCSHRPQIGERVTVLPNHCCPVTNLFEKVVGVRASQVEVVWPVAARGAVS